MKFIITLAWFVVVAVSALPHKQIRPISTGSSRIINGSPATLGQFPYQTTVRFRFLLGPTLIGGSLISGNWVLTSTHCSAATSNFTIDLGIIDLFTTNVQIEAWELIVHPDHNPITMQNDIALIHLDTTVEFNENIAPIALSSAYIGAGQDVIVSGWGATSDSSATVSQFLNWAELRTIENLECSYTYVLIFDEMICCTSQGPIKSTCNSDTGGALVIGQGATAQQIGINIFSNIACESGYPSGYTRIAPYRDWITEVSGV